jgi:hypothetical protein
MIAKREGSPKTKSKLSRIVPVIIILLVLIGLPWLFLNYQSKRSGLTTKEVVQGITNQQKNETTSVEKASDKVGEKITFLSSKPIGQIVTEPPLISNIAVTDLDKDGLLDVVVCDCRSNSVSWIRQYPADSYTETVLAKGLIAPAHVQVADFDKDGDNDVMVAVLGMLFPKWLFWKMKGMAILSNM